MKITELPFSFELRLYLIIKSFNRHIIIQHKILDFLIIFFFFYSRKY